MLGSPVPIYIGCAGLIVGSLGLGAQHMLGGNSSPAIGASVDQPLFARSVEEAALPVSGWPSQSVSVPHYDPMVELLTTPARTAQSPAAQPQNPPSAAQVLPPQSAQQPQQEQSVAPRETVRDLSQPKSSRESRRESSRESRRARNRNQDGARTHEEATVSTEQVDPRAARAQERQERARGQNRYQDRRRNTGEIENDRRDGESRRFDRRYREREDSESADVRSRSERRQREGDRAITREDVREPEPRVVRGPEPRDGGSTPFRLFGIFDR